MARSRGPFLSCIDGNLGGRCFFIRVSSGLMFPLVFGLLQVDYGTEGPFLQPSTLHEPATSTREADRPPPSSSPFTSLRQPEPLVLLALAGALSCCRNDTSTASTSSTDTAGFSPQTLKGARFLTPVCGSLACFFEFMQSSS